MTETCQRAPLRGLTVIWTGSPGGASATLLAIERAGAKTERHPLIEFGPPSNPQRFEGVLDSLEEYSWLVFTSAQAARSVAEKARPRARIAAVGPATAAQLEQQGWVADLIPDTHDASSLASALIDTIKKKEKVLFIRGSQARRAIPEQLEAAGVLVEEVEVYSTSPVGRDKLAFVARRIVEVADIVIAGSPSGVDALAEAVAPNDLGALKPGLIWCCLGRTTLAALETNGIKDAVCPIRVDPEAIVNSIKARINQG